MSDAAVLSGGGIPSRGGGGGGLFGKKTKKKKSDNKRGDASSAVDNFAAGACARSLDDRHYATFNEFFVHVGT